MKIKVIISGKVQGVFFRAYTEKKANELGLRGWVKNLPGGQVEAVFDGVQAKIEEMIEWCWQGSAGSKVTSVKTVKTEESLLENQSEGFEIKF
ncbi:MAG TPA: acylphosphatase [Candidatus Bathyarchaeia archaeon]|nr:acylphosphatase [Candidatus Bathyarchaeia archaeon]